MQLHGIRAKGKRRCKVTTDSHHELPTAPNLLNREFTVSEPDKVRAGDITYIATDEGGLFLAVVIDLLSRQVIGWSLRFDLTRDIVIDALRMAWFKRHPSKHAGVIFHSDRGRQYASKDYRDALATLMPVLAAAASWPCLPLKSLYLLTCRSVMRLPGTVAAFHLKVTTVGTQPQNAPRRRASTAHDSCR